MEHEIVHFVYCLSFSNGKVYIGMSRTDKRGLFTLRYNNHAKAANLGKDLPIYHAWRKYGAPTQSILSTHKTREECALSEIEFITKYDSINRNKGYNLCGGGEGLNIAPNSAMYELMRIKVWNNVERRKKCSEALKGRRPSQATIDASNQWKSSESGKEVFRKAWQNNERKEKASNRTRKQMAEGGSDHLKRIMVGRGEVRSEAGKEAQRTKMTALMNSEEGKKIAQKGYAAMAGNPENLKKWKEGTDRWRATEANKKNCRRMSQLSAQKSKRKVMLVSTGQKFESQTAMAEALNVSCACVSLWVKSGKVERI